MDYKGKLAAPDEAVSVIKSGDKIFTSGNAATPYNLLDALANRKDDLRNVEVFSLLLLGDDPLSAPEMEGHFRDKSLFVGPANRKAVNEGRADYFPIFLYEIPSLFRQQVDLDVAIIHTSPPDEHGFVSLGVETIASKAAAETAKYVIAQVNEKMPRTLGDCFVHISRINKIVEVSEDLPNLEQKSFTDIEKQIAQHITEIIGDGTTFQLGIGGIPSAVLHLLRDRKDLGIHTEMLSDGMMQAVEAGVVTNARKNLHPGKVIATFALGSNELYEYIHNNPFFEMHPVDYTNDPFVVAQNENMVAINSALEVDLTGQVCSDSIGYNIYSGFGGQVDFIRGAARSKGGKPIIALPSTAKSGQISRIVPHLKEGAGVVTSRGDVHYVATEFGIASLHGKSLRERAESLIQISHPDFRGELEAFAKERKYL
ncbi:acetyl-CoA hydrolase/transferase family protein [candidate division KSB1 bacterium]|nr:acetyl-CoA hydrolase/transferase family protein [candidate division KSB1 bacterium]NIR69782.1 acetyl-CoA hydrolase/transferase family protein [candidate division KSB1 bacterium]NIS22965.1 acetyl-CoA hydrolase/transferase family protein [candidate division KSB1 bacterium]NIT69822.1 acetyl-CoA hydrolase/transferase family protein [candidate division KSB1 bacterium]NIU23496.1 acetyl-CoA hydrolase/transferase family protein [candidate division KSB1 bacterium]